MSLRPCAVIPSRNHFRALPEIVARLRALDLPVLIFDDGSDAEAAAAIAALHAPERGVTVGRAAVNRGKGAAVVALLRQAAAAGFSHAVQVDADGQHDLDAVTALLEQARAHPDAVVSGAPVYDASVPIGRKIGRWITHVWVFVETLSVRITDSMCGFRVYPLAATLALLDAEPMGQRMDFDTEVMVRLFWRGVPPVMVPVRVTYPPGNTSNFALLGDNLRISWMHTRLVATLLLRLPRVLAHRPRRIEAAAHWAGLAERGAAWGLRFTAATLRLLGRRASLAVIAPVVTYFHLTGSAQRRASRRFLGRVFNRPPTRVEGWRHAMDFAARALDTVAAWSGALPAGCVVPTDPDALAAAVADPRGAVLIVSHHGNAELSRALMAPELRHRLTVLVHTRHAENFNRILAELRPEAALRLVQVTEIGPETAVALQERIERGEWVAIAGDRVPVSAHGRTVSVPFLGRPAPFSQGPYLLAALLGCPVRLLFCWREGSSRWGMALEPFADRVELPRGHRREAIAALAAAYALRLEDRCRRHPFQWYNFFDFWAEGERR